MRLKIHVVRARLDGICAAAGCRLQELDVQVITAPSVRLDLQADRERLERTIALLAPRLLILDPFVRLHRIDENASGEVAPLLAFLRELQRRHRLAVLLVHHARKSAGSMRAGQALRGSSEFHAWGDSNLYLRRSGNEITLSIEHRAASSPPDMTLDLAARGPALALEVRQSTVSLPPTPCSLDERITAALMNADRTLPIAQLRALCRVRNATLRERLAALTEAGQLVRCADGYRLAAR
jgi:AAA domain-containing protein